MSTLAAAQADVQNNSQSFGSESASAAEQATLLRARAAYDEGADAFARGRFGEALDRFSEAYELSARAELLYNIGTAHDRQGHRNAAIRYYQRYLAALPGADNREYTEARIAVLETEQAEREREAHLQETPGTQAPVPQNPSPNTPAIVLVSLGAAATVAAVATGVITLGRRSELDDLCPNRECEAAYENEVVALRRSAIATDVLVGAVGASLITGLVLFLLGKDDGSTVNAPQLNCGLSSCEARISF